MRSFRRNERSRKLTNFAAIFYLHQSLLSHVNAAAKAAGLAPGANVRAALTKLVSH